MIGASAAVALLSLSSLVSAAPAAVAEGWGRPGGHGMPGQDGCDNSTHAHNATSGPQVPFKFPLANGFPNIAANSTALKDIEKAAHGTLPNTTLPSNVSANGLTVFPVIANQEIFEVAYFSSLLKNITDGVDGYRFKTDAAKKEIVDVLTAVIAQEELHALGANAILTTNGKAAIQPCEYVFPVSNFADAIALAATFTDVVVGTLQDVSFNLGINKDTELIPLIASIIGQEGEQDGFYRSLEGFIPSGQPFLTASAGTFAFSALNQVFIVPGSCPNPINAPVLAPLTVVSKKIEFKDQDLDFSIKTNGSTDGLHVVYINGQNLPIVTDLKNVKKGNDGVTTFQASFPAESELLYALTISAVTNSAGPFTNAEEVAAATQFGPGLIEVK